MVLPYGGSPLWYCPVCMWNCINFGFKKPVNSIYTTSHTFDKKV